MADYQQITDGEKLFRYAKPAAFPVGQTQIPAGVYNDRELSCDWEKYRTTPETSFHVNEGKTLLIEITVHQDFRTLFNPRGIRQSSWDQEIVHKPISDEDDKVHGKNDAHSLIIGNKILSFKIISFTRY
jgi:hypothetical protein